MYKRKRAGNTITRKINSTKDTAAKADKNHYISNSYLEGFIPIDTEYFTASIVPIPCPYHSALLKSQYFFQELSWIHTDHKTLFLHRQVWAEYFYHFQNTQTPFPYHVQILRRLFV